MFTYSAMAPPVPLRCNDPIVRCSSRDAWDLIAGIGARGAYWAPTYIGVLPGIQQVYPPRASTLARLP